MTLDLAWFARYRVLPDALLEGAAGGSFMGYEDLVGVRHVLHGFRPPERPVLYATNASQKYDFLTFRAAMLRSRQRSVTVTKARSYHSAAMGPILERVGVIPLASRGYVLLVDASRTLRRRPTDDEYRAMRDHLDGDVALPATEAFEALRSRPRTILGVRYDPAYISLRDAWRKVYRAVMTESLRLARESIAAGYSINIYPEGTVSSRLGKGRIGVMLFAKALGARIVPVGMSGCREVFKGASIMLRAGTVDLRFGEPYAPDLSGLPDDFVPFDPEHERASRSILQGATDDLMTRIDALLSPEYQHREGHAPDGTTGTRRFL